MSELHKAISTAIENELKELDWKKNEISNYNTSRAAGTKVFTLIVYRNKKTQKGDTKMFKVALDSTTETLLAGIECLDSMMDEVKNMKFLDKAAEKPDLKPGERAPVQVATW